MLAAVFFGVIGSTALGVLFIVRSRRARWLNLVVGLFLLNSAAIIVLIALSHTDSFSNPDRIELLEHGFALAAGPLLLALVVYGTTDNQQIRFSVIHFLPAVTMFAYAIMAQVLPLQDVLGSLPVILHQSTYTAISTIVLFRRHAWQKWPALLVLVVWAIHVAQGLRLVAPTNEVLRDIVPIVGVAALNLFVLVALHQSALLDKLVPVRRYARSGLDMEDIPAKVEILLTHLQRTEAYRDRELSLAKLAAQLGWTEYMLSQVINEGFGTSFNELIKGLRLDYAKGLLSDPGNRRYSVESLGLDAGFGSRAAFYRAFTEREDASPADFRRRIDG